MWLGIMTKQLQAITLKKVGIKRVIGQVLPQKKSRVISWAGKSVIMVGDGINDAPALATADIGVLWDEDRYCHGKCRYGPYEGNLSWMSLRLWKLVRRLSQLDKENLFWAFIYNILSIPVAVGVLHLFEVPSWPNISRTCHWALVLPPVDALRLKRRKV